MVMFTPTEKLPTQAASLTRFDRFHATEVVTDNPRHRPNDISSDIKMIRYLKLRSKEGWFKRKETLANEIIPRTKNHGAWILGAQLLEGELQRRRAENRDPKTGLSIPVVRVSMLTDREMVKHPTEKSEEVVRLRWFDHGTLDVTTGKNQTVREMSEFQSRLRTKLTAEQADVYCHCMAGRSRSLFQTIAYMYYHPDQEKLLDVDDPAWEPLWEKAREQALRNLVEEKVREELAQAGKTSPSIKEVKKLVKERMKNVEESLKTAANLRVEDLKKRLKDNPSITDIGELVRLQRPTAKPLEKLDGDQGGLLGLMALDKMTQDGCKLIKERAGDRLLRDAQNIGFSLVAPLDRGFRDEQDLKEQDRKFVVAYNAFKDRDVNLLMAMVVPVKETVGKEYNQVETFAANFAKLKPSEQARFAILMKRLEDAGADLSPFAKGDALHYAERVIISKDAKKLTAGDYVELLRAFGEKKEKGFSYEGAVEKILKGNSVDKHNAGIQLAELAHIASQRGDQPAVIKDALAGNKLSEVEKQAFLSHLHELNDPSIEEYSKIIFKKEVKERVVLNEEQALRQFKDWFNGARKGLSLEDKQRLVQQFMFDSKTHNPGNPEKLMVVLRACSQKDLGPELYGRLKEQYPQTSGTKLANSIASLPEIHGIGWHRKPREEKPVEKVEQKWKVATVPTSPRSDDLKMTH